MDEDPVDLVGGVNGSLDLALAALDGLEEGITEVGAVETELIAQEVEGVAEEGITLLGHIAVDDDVATAVDGGVHTSFGPNLIGEEDVGDVADAGEVAGDEVGAGARDGEEVVGSTSSRLSMPFCCWEARNWWCSNSRWRMVAKAGATSEGGRRERWTTERILSAVLGPQR